MGKYTTRPAVVDAFRFGFETYPDWFIENLKCNNIIIYADGKNKSLSSFLIISKGDNKKGIFGDYIVKDNDGKIYSFKPEIFETAHQKVI